jgi:anaerobic C4-dicarboxylate transporter DcuA
LILCKSSDDTSCQARKTPLTTFVSQAGIPAQYLAAAWPAVNGYFFLPTYGTLIAAINFDRSGTTGIGKYILNHSFMLPGLVATITSVVVGLVIAKVVF